MRWTENNTWEYVCLNPIALYTKNSGTNITGTFADVTFDNNIRQTNPFSRSGANVTFNGMGLYLVEYQVTASGGANSDVRALETVS